MLLPVIFYWLMLLPIYVADVIATFCGIMWWQMLLPGGRWNSHCRMGGIEWLMLLPQGRCYCHGSMIYFNLSSGMLTEPHPIYVADGTCQYFYSGMDC